MSSAPRTLFDKLWDAHVVVPETDAAPDISDVIPAKAGIHLDLALLPGQGMQLTSKAKVKMDPSFRWDDDASSSRVSSNLIIALSEAKA